MHQKVVATMVSWRKELFLLLVAAGVLAPISTAQAQCKPGTNYHYHAGAEHCDSGGSGCEVVCVPPV